jgi:hypothetical protein
VAAGVVLLLTAAGAAGSLYLARRYHVAAVMAVPITEYGNAQYPEDPARRSLRYGSYDGRALTLVQRDATHFDFVLEPLQPAIARIVIRDVDVGLMTPSLPEWAKADAGLRRIALTDRQWNRQQVGFDAGSPHIEITGGDGVETAHLSSVALAKNCLNAGLWEILLFEQDGGDKALYYHDWFTFPLGHYKRIFERSTGLAYWRNWYFLEHWSDPAGTIVPMDKLRQVIAEREVPATFDQNEPVIVAGEQVHKRRTVLTDDIREWRDFFDGRDVQLASFVPPGRYSVQVPRDTEYPRMDRFEQAILRTVRSPATTDPLAELELVFSSTTRPGKIRFLVSGFDPAALPRLPIRDYPRGFYMPMGIGTPPFFQSYDALQQHPPERSPYVSVLLDEHDRWIDHHSVGIDGPVMHLDATDPDLLHVYLLSYERHTLIAHLLVRLNGNRGPVEANARRPEVEARRDATLRQAGLE